MIRRLTPVLHRLDHALGRLGAPRHVLVELRTPGYEAILGPVATALARDPAVRIWYTSEYADRIRPLVRQGRFLTHAQVEWRRFDLYLNADPWAAARLRRCAHRINFFHGVAGKYDLDSPTGLPMGFEVYDHVAFVNRDRMRRYLDAKIVTPRQAVLVGYPKLDALARGDIDGAAVRAGLALDPGRPAALYAPTYGAASSLHLAGEAIVRALARAGFSVIVKLHDRSLDSDPRYTAGVDWRARFAALRCDGRIAFVEDANACPLMAAADLLVTDHSSIGFEYLVLDRPLLIYDAPDLARVARINPEKVALLRGAARLARTPEELAAAARAELHQPGRLSHARRNVAGRMFHAPGTATGRAVSLARALLFRDGTRRTVGEHVARLDGGLS